MPIIDVHAHFYPPAYLDHVRRLAHGSGPAADEASRTVNHQQISGDPVFTGAFEERLGLMDQAGIEQQVLSFSTPNIWRGDRTVRQDLARAFNDGCAEVGARYAGRFRFFAMLPLPFVEEAIEEARRVQETLGAAGVEICTHMAGLPVDHPRLDPLYTFLNDQQGVVFFHPDGFPSSGEALKDYAMEWALGAPFEDTIVLVRLIYSGLLERFPAINFVVPHLGGTLPFLVGRLDAFWATDPALQRAMHQLPSASLRASNLFVDTVTPQLSALALALSVFGPERLVFGSDFPFAAARQDMSPGVLLLREVGLSEEGSARVLFQNSAARLWPASHMERASTRKSQARNRHVRPR